MNFDVAISRVATYATPVFTAQRLGSFPTGVDLRSKFRRQADLIATDPDFRRAQDEILKVLKKSTDDFVRLPCAKAGAKDGTGDIQVLNIRSEFLGSETESSDALYARLKSDRYQLRIKDAVWILRTRASATSCALEGKDRPTKLWWTFEGIPAIGDVNRRPHEDDVVRLLQITDDLERAARDGFKAAFERTLFKVLETEGCLDTDKREVHICAMESVDDNVDALLDAVYFDGRQPSAISASTRDDLAEARKGISLFDRFVRKTIGEKAVINDATIFFPRGIPRLKGIFCRHEIENKTYIIGFARKTGARIGDDLLSESEQSAELAEENVRLRSAARPLSAWLANAEAMSHEKMPEFN